VSKDTQKIVKIWWAQIQVLWMRVKNGKDFVAKQPTRKELPVDGDDKDKGICHNAIGS
jgi:hypothetical protein